MRIFIEGTGTTLDGEFREIPDGQKTYRIPRPSILFSLLMEENPDETSPSFEEIKLVDSGLSYNGARCFIPEDVYDSTIGKLLRASRPSPPPPSKTIDLETELDGDEFDLDGENEPFFKDWWLDRQEEMADRLKQQLDAHLRYSSSSTFNNPQFKINPDIS